MLIKIFVWAMTIVYISKLLIDDESPWVLYLGDLTTFLDGDRYFYNIPLSIYNILTTIIVLTFHNASVKDLSWITNFAFIQGIVPPNENDIRTTRIVRKLILRFKLSFWTASYFVVSTASISGIAVIVVSILNLSLEQCLTLGLFWLVITMAFSYYVVLYVDYNHILYHSVHLATILQREIYQSIREIDLHNG